MIAPSCPSLLQRKLELKNIQYIESKKVIEPEIVEPTPPSTAVNINTADKASLIIAFQGTGVKGTTIDKLITRRQSKRYINLDELASERNFSAAVKAKLQAKVNKAEICF